MDFTVAQAVRRGGVANAESIPQELPKEVYEVGNRRGHYRAFVTLLHNTPNWEAATKVYGEINVPVLLVWGIRIGQHSKNASAITAGSHPLRW